MERIHHAQLVARVAGREIVGNPSAGRRLFAGIQRHERQLVVGVQVAVLGDHVRIADGFDLVELEGDLMPRSAAISVGEQLVQRRAAKCRQTASLDHDRVTLAGERILWFLGNGGRLCAGMDGHKRQ